jgi:hypothetical protein
MSNRNRNSRDGQLPKSMEPVELWSDPVDGEALLTAIRNSLRSYMALPAHAAETVALWVLHSHCHDVAEHSPILAIQSPEKRCGKTTLLNILGRLVPVPLPAANVTTPVIFRAIERFQPTLLLDEVETFIRDNEEMRGVLNSGFTRESAMVLRCVGDDHEPRPFSTWCPKAGALIGNLPDTLQDRSIVITLRRRLASERSERFGRKAHGLMLMLHRQAARWAADNLDMLGVANDPLMPRGLGDRAEDAWRPLLTLADAVGGDWPDVARTAALAISGAMANDADSQSRGVLLLAHIRELLRTLDVGSLQSSHLVHKLNENEEWPWGEWRGGKPISARGVAMILKPYGVRPRQNSAGSFYSAVEFNDAWDRYLPALPGTSATSANESENVINVRELKRPGMRAVTTLQVPAIATNGTCSRSHGTSWQMENGGQTLDASPEMAIVALEEDEEGELL